MSVNIIPVPKELKQDPYGGSAVFKAVMYVPEKWIASAKAFASYASSAGACFSICAGEAEAGQAIRVIRVTESAAQKYSGGYEISVGTSGAEITAADVTSFNHALATVFQIMKNVAGTHSEIVLPLCRITDGPDLSYRGMMVDLARYWHPFEFLLSYVDTCWYYKLSALHLHFTDDQSYTLPGKAFPNLSTSGRSYSFEEIRRLNKYASDRGIEIIPEIDVPGHNSGFALAYPELFGTKGIICQHKDSVDAVSAVFSEVCDLFPYSRHIHIGGDEANLRKWLDCPECMEYAKSTGIDTSLPGEEICDRLYVNFIVRMAAAVKEKGRIPIVWEGFPKNMNDLVPRDIVVMSWENFYQITPDLLEAGFTIINCSWNPMYIVAPDVKWTPEEVCDWSVYKWRPVHPGSPFIGSSYTSGPSDQIIGGQLLAWGDRVISMFAGNENEGARVELGLLLERVPFLAQNTWNKDSGLVYNDIRDNAAAVSGRIGRIALGRVSDM
ncbi:MAG: family 20 glycosylhydrolase [Clostridia bacterium]|nr:family 20 glycosylhydrolase [Clostridia bacterium]